MLRFVFALVACCIAVASACAFALAAASASTPAAWSGDDAASIRVGTFNIRYANEGDGPNAWRHRRALALGILRTADFWGLQEAVPEQVRDIEQGCTEFKLLSRSREMDPAKGEACPILYRADRWELDPTEHGTFWLSETPEVAGSKSWDSSLPRICTFARFTARTTAGVRALYVFNIHLDHRGPAARLESAKLVAQRIKARKHADPVILLGDFNCGPASEPVKVLLGDAALGLRDAWRETNPEAPEQGTFNGWAEKCGDERIDWILFAGGLDVESASIDADKREGRWPSDHAIVRAEFVWRAPARPAPPSEPIVK
jgi:endonuclease/exonuclease/phosphatase family metal-dependent hydrolase